MDPLALAIEPKLCVVYFRDYAELSTAIYSTWIMQAPVPVARGGVA